jgi:hypothetical protein
MIDHPLHRAVANAIDLILKGKQGFELKRDTAAGVGQRLPFFLEKVPS